MTRDLRRRALESHKTISKKTASRIASGTASETASGATSRTHSRNVSRHGSEDEDGDVSDSTAWSVNSLDDLVLMEPAGEDLDPTTGTRLGDRIDELINRKGSTNQGREHALAFYDAYLMKHYVHDQIQSKTGELFPVFLKSVKMESSERESFLALKAIALTLVTIPSETAYDGIVQQLKRTYSESEYPIIKAVAIHTLSTAAIHGGAADSEIEEIMDEFLEIIESDGSSIEAEDNGQVVEAALSAWGFLATYIDDMEDKTESAMDSFVEQLDSSDTSVQIAAGENIALLYEKSYTDREAGDEPASEEEDEEGCPIDNSYVKRYEVYRQKNQLEHKLTQLSKVSSKRIAKKDRRALHTNFSDMLSTVEQPTRGPRFQRAIDQETGKVYGSRMVVRINQSGSMRIDKWWKLHRLQALRRVLGGGFVNHYENNAVVFDSLPIMMSSSSD